VWFGLLQSQTGKYLRSLRGIAQIKNNFPIYFDSCQNLWRGAKGLIIAQEELEDMPYFQHRLIKEALRATS
jgi:hypothetical protein